jgi:hypothetical protein
MDDTIELLRRQALDWRNVAISAAKREYYSAMKAIRDLERKVRDERRGRRMESVYDQPLGPVRNTLGRKTMIASVAEVLGEGKPMSLPELTIELQRRGVRSRDDPRVVANSVRVSLRNKRFKRDDKGRWSVVS